MTNQADEAYKINTYKINIDGDWTLVDFYKFPHVYSQVYSLLYSLQFFEQVDKKRLEATYQSFPWAGGFSAVNFYNGLYRLIPKTYKPVVVSIRYSSPGWIELSLAIGVAIGLKQIVKHVATMALEVNSAYDQIYKDMQKRKLLSLDVKSKELNHSKEELKFIEESSESFAKLLGFNGTKEITKLTQNRLATLKILLSFYRRIRTLKEFEDKEKLQL